MKQIVVNHAFYMFLCTYLCWSACLLSCYYYHFSLLSSSEGGKRKKGSYRTNSFLNGLVLTYLKKVYKIKEKPNLQILPEYFFKAILQ